MNFYLGCFVFLLTAMGWENCGTSKLLENIQNLFAVYTNTFDQSHIFNLDLLQKMSLHLKYIIQAVFYKEKKITACNFVKISPF